MHHIIGCIASLLSVALAQTTFTFLNDLESQYGLGWPRAVETIEGHDALLRLRKPLLNQVSCNVTTTLGVTFDVASPPDSRYESWGGDHCGVRVKNVSQSDVGRWRLTAAGADDQLTAFIEVHIREPHVPYESAPIHLQDGQANAPVELTSLGDHYCLVTQPYAASSLIPGHCLVTLDRASRAVQGAWHVVTGLPGQVPEYTLDRTVVVEAERLDVGHVIDAEGHKAHLYCNILNSQKTMTFCRFQKLDASSGFNLMDGLSDGEHSYYGDGFAARHCGMTIEHLSESDFASWRCSVGVQETTGSQVTAHSPMQALVTLPPPARTGSRSEAHDDTSVFAQAGAAMTVSCRAGVSLSYCWLQGPGGAQYASAGAADDDGGEFWYSGKGLTLGDCSITLASAKEEHSGTWVCHMGPNQAVGLELTDSVQVRVVGPLAANQKEVQTSLGGEATLYCHTSNGNRALDYCRFVSPTNVGMNLDSSVTVDSALLGRYHFTERRATEYGDCSLTIASVLEEDLGAWTCAGLISGQTAEASDTVTVSLADGSYGSSKKPLRAGFLGGAGGVAFLLIVLGGVYLYKRDKLPMWRTMSDAGSVEMQVRPSNMSSTLSSGTDSSSVDLTFPNH